MTFSSSFTRLVLVSVVLTSSSGGTVQAGSRGVPPGLAELSMPPFDTADAERVRIWLPVERGGTCRVTVTVLDSANQAMRHLVDLSLKKGYYNFYWDKKDDSGGYVPPGRYRYVANDCNKRSYGYVEARFHRWELTSRLYSGEDTSGTWLELTEDSALVSAVVLNQRRQAIDSLFTDSLMHQGRHRLIWRPGQPGYNRRFLLQVEVGGYVHPLTVITADYAESDDAP